MLYDVRTPAEYEDGHIEQAKSLPLTDLLNQAPDIPKDQKVIVTCGAVV